ncbi:TRAP transporter small permease [Pollutimonas bauzanensis]|uniref:TRAP transporter small permease protein n=1 Tax=Pollutimonas bauzanensis TaxID=658167 RepID=A0A1M5Z0K7_9BURK|nr:TRAP transporter small permease [Pollutimonas bauzanensis]SHI17807.1 TRAP-type C4-dicarboxylate transport system, small permease component [Pollutimonas bauzanensis]
MRPFFHRIGRIASGVNHAAVTVSEFALLVLMLITAYAVIARYVFHSPSIFAVEISTYVLLLVAWASVGWVHKVDRHVSMEALNLRLTGRWKKTADAISELTILVFCAVLIWAGSNVMITAFERNYRSASLLKFPVWIAYSLIPIGGILLGLVALSRFKRIVLPSSDTSPKE